MFLFSTKLQEEKMVKGLLSTYEALIQLLVWVIDCIEVRLLRFRVVLFIYMPVIRVQGSRLSLIFTCCLKTGRMAKGVKELVPKPDSLLGITC